MSSILVTSAARKAAQGCSEEGLRNGPARELELTHVTLQLRDKETKDLADTNKKKDVEANTVVDLS